MEDQGKNTRRRGDALLESIYEAAEKIMQTEGYQGLTFQKIAQQASTSRSVIYSHWETPFELIHEIIAYKMKNILEGALIDRVQDTGSLRGDLIHIIFIYQAIYDDIGKDFMNAVLLERSRNIKNVTNLYNNALEKNALVTRKILEQARSRGEKVNKVGDTALNLPFDLIRMRSILQGDSNNESWIEHIVDEILLPVYLEKKQDTKF